jgi:asparagine synthase (glutamine-hydrolysing)
LSGLIPPHAQGIEKADRRDKLRAVLSNADTVKRFMTVNEVYTTAETRRLISSAITELTTCFDEGQRLDDHNDDLSRILATEYRTYLPEDILRKVDMATMSASLEGREPFLDHKVLEWSARLPSEFKLKDGVQKRILKDIVHRHVPRQLMERPKMGFGVPLVKWLKLELRDLLEEVMDEKTVASTGVLDVEAVSRIRKAYLDGRLENFERLWFVFSFLLWYKKWMR